MKSIINSVRLIGNLGQDVEVVNFESGSKKATISLATTEYGKNQKGEVVKNTFWHKIVAWGKNAELMAKTLNKGSMVVINGTINYRVYEDKEGITRYVTEILVQNFMKVNESQKATA